MPTESRSRRTPGHRRPFDRSARLTYGLAGRRQHGEVVLRVSLTAPDSEEIQVDRRLHVAYDPAIPLKASELLAKSVTLPEAVKETLSQRKLSVTVAGATKPQ
jgi:hypothetical protein